jgi:predicted ATP-binding protein involved in virulence
MEAEKKLRKIGLLSHHAYTVLAVNLAKQTVTVVNPHDSSKAMVLDASSLMFNFLLLAKAPTTEERFATAPSKAETA